MFANPPFETTWLRAPRGLDDISGAALRRVLGAELARSVLADGPPPSGRALVVAVLQVASRVEAPGGRGVARSIETIVEGLLHTVMLDPRAVDEELCATTVAALASLPR